MASYDITRIAGNIGALNSLNALERVNNRLANVQAKLASGKNINSAADDPAGLSIATKLNTRSEGLKTALSNIGDAQNLLSTAETGMSKINDILTDMRNKAQQGASDTMGSAERQALIDQMTADAAQIQDSVDQTQWNGNKLLDGLKAFANGTLTFQTGANSTDTTTLSGVKDMGVVSLGLGTAGAIEVADAAGSPVSSAWSADNSKLGTGATGFNYSTWTLSQTASGAPGTGTWTVMNGTNAVLDSAGHAVTAAYDSATGKVNISVATGGVVASFKVASDPTTAAHQYSVSYDTKGFTLDSSAGKPLDASSSSAAADFGKFMDLIDKSQTIVNNQLAQLGSLQSRLTYKQDQVTDDQANVEAAFNRIMNADMASQQVESSKLQILQQTSTAMLAQANTAPQFILSLFK